MTPSEGYRLQEGYIFYSRPSTIQQSNNPTIQQQSQPTIKFSTLSKMKILVGVKRVVDYAVKVRVGANGVELKNVKMSLNPFCEIAVEEAVRLKENKAAKVSEVVALSIGPKQCQETLRTALAMGCDRGIHIQTDLRGDYMELQSDSVAKLFQNIVEKENDFDLVLVGKQAIDSDCGQVGPMLAQYLGWPQATFAAKIDLDGEGLTVERETDSGTETIKIPKLPAVISCDLRLVSSGTLVCNVTRIDCFHDLTVYLY